MADGVEEVSLAQAGAAVDEQRVVTGGWLVSDCQGGGVS